MKKAMSVPNGTIFPTLVHYFDQSQHDTVQQAPDYQVLDVSVYIYNRVSPVSVLGVNAGLPALHRTSQFTHLAALYLLTNRYNNL